MTLQESGWTPERAAQGAQQHVARIEAAMQRERARLEAEAIAHLHEAADLVPMPGGGPAWGPMVGVLRSRCAGRHCSPSVPP